MERQRLLTTAAGLLLAVLAAAVYYAPETVLMLVPLALASAFFFTHPHWGVLTIFVLTMFRLRPAAVGPLSTSELLALALALPLALELLRDRRIWVLDVPQIRLLLGIGGVLVLATGWSLLMHRAPPTGWLHQPWAETFFFSQSLLFLIYFLYFIKTPRHLVHAVIVFLLVIVAAAADGTGIVHHSFRPSGGRAATTYFEGLAGNANRLGFLCVWGTTLLWMLRSRGPTGWWRPLTVPPLLALPVATLMTGSRSAFLQLSVLGALIVMDQRRSSPVQGARAVVLIVTVAVLILVAAPAQMLLRATNIETGESPTTIARINALRGGLTMIAEHPILGIGPGNFEWRNHALTGSRNSPHNAYLWALVSGGPLVLILYLALFYRTYQMLRALERWGPSRFVWLATGLRFNLIILLVGSCFATLWGSEPFWLLLGLTIVLGRIAGRRAPRTARLPELQTVGAG